MGVDRMLSTCYAKRDGNMHGMETKYFQKTFRKPHRVPLMPGGDDELGNHLMSKWCTEASVCVVFKSD